MNLQKLISIVARSAIYVQESGEGIRIDYYDTLDEMEENDLTEDELGFYGTGEESGEQYKIEYKDIDLDKDMFYELKVVDTSDL